MQKSALPEPGELMTITQTAAILGVNPFTIRRWIKNGKLEAMRIGEKLLKIKAETIAKFLEASQIQTTSIDFSFSCGNLKNQLIDQAKNKLDTLDQNQLLSIEQAATLIGKKPNTIQKARQRGYLKGTRQGRNWYYLPADLKAWLKYLQGEKVQD